MKMSKQFPVNALRVFEAVARHNSFTRAGDELGMTQTAVSYPIKIVDDNIGAALFLRQTRQIPLTGCYLRHAKGLNCCAKLLLWLAKPQMKCWKFTPRPPLRHNGWRGIWANFSFNIPISPCDCCGLTVKMIPIAKMRMSSFTLTKAPYPA